MKRIVRIEVSDTDRHPHSLPVWPGYKTIECRKLQMGWHHDLVKHVLSPLPRVN